MRTQVAEPVEMENAENAAQAAGVTPPLEAAVPPSTLQDLVEVVVSAFGGLVPGHDRFNETVQHSLERDAKHFLSEGVEGDKLNLSKHSHDGTKVELGTENNGIAKLWVVTLETSGVKIQFTLCVTDKERQAKAAVQARADSLKAAMMKMGYNIEFEVVPGKPSWAPERRPDWAEFPPERYRHAGY